MTAGLAARTWADFRSHWRVPLALHLMMQLLGVAIFTPIVTWIGRRIVLASGEPVISNFDIAAFALSPAGLAFALVIAALTVSLLLAEFAGQSWIAGHAIARHRVTVWSTLAFVLRLLPRLILLSTRVFLRLLLLALPFLAAVAVVWFTMLGGHDINYYLAEHPPEWQRAKTIAVLLAAAYALLAAWQLARWLYAVPALVFAGVSPARALADSADATRGRVVRIVVPLLLWWLLLTAATIAITWACRQVTDAGLDWAGIDVRRVLPLVAVYLVVTAGRRIPVWRPARRRTPVPRHAHVRRTDGWQRLAATGRTRDQRRARRDGSRGPSCSPYSACWPWRAAWRGSWRPGWTSNRRWRSLRIAAPRRSRPRTRWLLSEPRWKPERPTPSSTSSTPATAS